MYLVVTKNGHILKRYKNKEKAIDYMINCWFDGMDGVKIVTEKEYIKNKSTSPL